MKITYQINITADSEAEQLHQLVRELFCEEADFLLSEICNSCDL